MSDINQQLKEYLSRSDRNGNVNNKTGPSAKSFKTWFGNSSTTTDGTNNSNIGNGWFNEAEKDPWFPSLGRRQRIVGFVGCLVMGIFCFCLAGLYAPLLLLKARKFALLYTLGSLFVISSFSFLWGPYYHVKHLFSRERIPFTTVYFGTMIATLYGALWIRSTLLTAVCSILQVIALCWYVLSYIPGGQTGMKFFSKIFTSVVTKTASKTLPV